MTAFARLLGAAALAAVLSVALGGAASADPVPNPPSVPSVPQLPQLPLPVQLPSL